MLDVTLPIAFVFGLISFLSPCVLPLVPAYISYLGGRMVYSAESAALVGPEGQTVAPRGFSMRFGLLMHGFAFVMGFTIVFVLLGIMTTALIQQVGGLNISSVIGIISRLGGVMIIFFGLHFSDILPDLFRRARAITDGRVHAVFVLLLAVLGSIILIWGFAGRLALWTPAFSGAMVDVPVWPDVLALAAAALLLLLMVVGGAFTAPRAFIVKLTNTIEMALYADTRHQMEQNQTSGLLGSLLMGVIFSAGWSPCIGTIYGSILTMSAQTGDIARTTMQLTAYSLGLGIPFLLAAVALDSVQGIFRKINKRMKMIKVVSGLLLVLIGLLVASGELARVTLQLSSGELGDFSLALEDRALEALVGPQE